MNLQEQISRMKSMMGVIINNNGYICENKTQEMFKIIDKTIREYIKQTLKTNTQIAEYVPNTHIAETFKDVLIYSELEDKYPDVYHYVKEHPYDSLGPKSNPDDYDILPDGRFQKKQTYSVGINHLLIPEYFDLMRLKLNSIEEIRNTYNKLREKRDEVRNKIKLGRIVTPLEFHHQPYAKSYKLKIK